MQTAIVNNTTYHVYTEDEMSKLNMSDFEKIYPNPGEDLDLVDLDDWDDGEVSVIEVDIASQLDLTDEWFAYIPANN